MESEQSDGISRVRNIAVQILYDVMEKGAYANLALEKSLKKSSLSVKDKNMLTEIVNGTVRMLKHLDWVLNLFLSKHISKLNPNIRSILRISLYQILFMDRVPDYAVVNDAVAISRQRCNRNLARLSNGVLRNIIRNKDKWEFPSENTIEYLALYYSHPEWIVELLVNVFGIEESKRILEYHNQRPKVVIRINSLSGKREEVLEDLRHENTLCEPSPLSPWAIEIKAMDKSLGSSETYQKGGFYVQNEASMLAAPILNPQEGDVIYDLCCGLGGKTTHLAEYINKRGKIHAYDIFSKKLALMRENCARLGIDNIQGYKMNVLDIDTTAIEATRVLLDVPCSGLGVLNRRADARWHKNMHDISKLQNLQRELIKKAGEMVAKNGFLLYSSCTINPAENEEIVSRFINGGKFVLTGFAEQISFFPLDEKDKEDAARGMLTISPGKYQTDGMFYALMRRNIV